MSKPNIPTKEGLFPKIGQFLWGSKTPASAPTSVSKSDEQKIIQIVNEFKNQSRQELQDWRSALDQANDIDNPSWNALQDLYDYLEPDAQLGISQEIRVASTLSIPFKVVDKKTRVEIPEKTDIFKNKEWFFNFTWNFIETIFKGYTGAYLYDATTMKFQYLPHRNLVPQQNFLLTDISNRKGISLDDKSIADRIIFVKYKKKYGIINDIVPNLIWKKNSKQAWMEFSEKFGIPPIWATTTKSDKKTLDLIETMLKQLGEAATAVLPAGTTIQIQDQATKGDPYNVFLKSIEYDDAQIAKRFLGGTMITDNGSSRSQSEVHERTLKETLSLFDKMLITFVVNDYLMPMMAKFGSPFTENDVWEFDETEKLSVQQLVDAVDKLSNHYEVDIEWLKKNSPIPVVGLKQTATPAPTNFNDAPSAFAAALGALGVTLPKYVNGCGHLHNMPTASFMDNLLSELSDALINDVWNGKETLINEVLKSIKTHQTLLDGLFEGWGDRRMNISYDTPDNHCLAAMEYNLFEFSRLKEKSNVIALNHLLVDKEKNNIRSEADFIAQAQKYLDNPDKNWLRTERNYAVAVGQGSSRYHQFMSERASVTNYGIIQTVGDSHVRDKHALMNGKIVRFDEKGGIQIWTPFDVGCRCEILQYLGIPNKDLLIDSDGIFNTIGKKKGDKWTGNKALTEQVFAANEMYIQKLGLADETNKLTYDKYGLKPYGKIKNLFAKLKLDKTITPENANELFKKEDGKDYMGFKDYQQRNIVMKQKVFTNHTTLDKYTSDDELRHQLFPHVTDVLNNPDEVYMFKRGKGNWQTNYVKYYNNKAIVVNTQLGKQNLEINTWYEMKAEDEVRKGYLMNLNKKS